MDGQSSEQNHEKHFQELRKQEFVLLKSVVEDVFDRKSEKFLNDIKELIKNEFKELIKNEFKDFKVELKEDIQDQVISCFREAEKQDIMFKFHRLNPPATFEHLKYDSADSQNWFDKEFKKVTDTTISSHQVDEVLNSTIPEIRNNDQAENISSCSIALVDITNLVTNSPCSSIQRTDTVNKETSNENTRRSNRLRHE